MIIAAAYCDLAGSDYGGITPGGDLPVFPNRSSWGPGTGQSDPFTADFKYNKFSNGYNYATGEYAIDVGAVQNPAEKEYWFRCFFKSTTQQQYCNANVVLGWLSKYDATAGMRHIGSLQTGGTSDYTLKWVVRDPTVSGSPAVATQNLGAISLIGRSTNGDQYIDVRVFLDATAGFVQVYDYTGLKIMEFLGKTTNGALPTHAIAASSNLLDYNSFVPVFAIAANESTQGMYMVPMRAKAEGSLQNQDSGFTYTNVSTRPLTGGTGIQMTVGSGITGQYTMTPKNMTDVALPANYVVRALQLSAALDGVSAQPTLMQPSHLVKFKSSSNVYSYPVDEGIVPNYNGPGNGKYQSRHKLLNLNPDTGVGWTVADMANIEIGFSITG